MHNSFSKVWLIVRRELRDQFRDWRILTPMLILTLGFPFFMNEVAFRTVAFFNQFGGGTIIVDRLVPASIFIIGFFPVTVALVVALEAFVGEKERGTIEPMLSSPIEGRDLYLGKLITGAFTPTLASYLSISVYLVLVSRQHLEMPSPAIVVQLFALTTAHSILMISAAIVISIQSTSIKAANLLASFVVVPVAVLMQSEASLLFFSGKPEKMLWLVAVAVLMLAALLIRLGMSHFQREYLLGREIDEFDPKRLARSFWADFSGNAQSIGDWYSRVLKDSLYRLRIPVVVMVFIALIGGVIGYQWAIVNVPSFMQKASAGDVAKFTDMLKSSPDLQNIGGNISATFLFFHNVRTMVIILILGLVSFSVLGVFAYLANAALIGGVLGVFHILGYSPLSLFMAGILPHGIFEIPALMLASAAVLRLGVMVVTPQLGKSMGEIFVELLADWTKIFVGLVVPLLVVAAIIETYITPAILLATLNR